MHPFVGRIAIGLIVWTVGAVWVLFSHSYYGPLLYGIVTLPVGFFVLLTRVLVRLGPRDAQRPSTFNEWLHGQLDTATGPIVRARGRDHL